MFKAIPGQTAGPNWIKKFNGTHGFFNFIIILLLKI